MGSTDLLAAEITKEDLLKACVSLFGAEIDITVEFLKYLKPSGVKVAYRKKAMETHPDRARVVDGAADFMEKRFKEINDAYQILQEFLAHPEKFSLDENGAIRKRRPHPSPSTACRKSHRDGAEPLYRGKIPTRKLRFGQYLYYGGYIPFSAMIRAIVWQRLQRPSIGAMALNWGWMDGGDVIEILRRRRRGERFGECALRFGFLSEEQVLQLLDKQKKLQPKIGGYFVEQKFIEPSQLFRLLVAMKMHNYKYPSY